MKNAVIFGLVAVLAMALTGCGSSGSSATPSSDSSTITSLTQIPDVDTMVSGGSTSTSLSLEKAVSGASSAPLLRAITSTTAKTLFWKSNTTPNGNLVDDILADNTLAQTQADNFWPGEGSCRMAQMVGFAMQGLKSAGTSACYMKNMPSVVGASSLVTASGSTAITTPSEIFNKQTGDIIVKAIATGAPQEGGEAGDQLVYIKVYGTSNSALSSANDYFVDLWFCASTTSTPVGYEQLRYTASTGALEKTSVNTGNGTFQSVFSATVTEDTNGIPIFDTASNRTITTTFSGTFDSTAFIDRTQVTVSGDQLSAKSFNVMESSQRKNFAVAQYSGDDVSDLRFLQGAYKGTETTGSFSYSGGVEFQTDHYQGLSSIDLVSDADIASVANSYSFAADSFFTTAPTSADIPTNNLSNFSCDPTVNYTVTMNFSDTAVAAIATTCESDFSGMQFCDSDTINSARMVLFQQQ